MLDSKERFSDRVDSYVKFRPTYPGEAVECLINRACVTGQTVIADIGSGTGKFTELLLSRGFKVYAVEPNQNMRTAAEKELSCYTGFYSADGSAEQTSLHTNSVDLITVAQAFHWFDRDSCKIEWQRILKPGGKTALIWNRRAKLGSDFMKEYEIIIKHFGNNPNFEHDGIDEKVFKVFFEKHDTFNFKWAQHFDFESLWGRAQSSSYSPSPGQPGYERLKQALLILFNKHQKDGLIDFEYTTEMTIGEL